MGGWDIYCALCGGPFDATDPFHQEDYNSDTRGLDPEIITGKDLEWLEKAHALGFNPDSFTVNKCFITGVGETQDYGGIECERGNDPNVPCPDTSSSLPTSKINLSIYSNYDPNVPFAAAFHMPCLRVFAQTLTYRLSGTVTKTVDLESVDKDILYAAMVKCHVEYAPCLDLPYGELQDLSREQYWYFSPGIEAWLSNPFTTDQLQGYYEQLKTSSLLEPEPDSKAGSDDVSKSLTLTKGSLFAKLSREIVLEILLHLPFSDVKSFALSGLVSFNLRNVQSFWKRKLLIDMPWLWDFPVLEGRQDWFQIYHTMQYNSFTTTPTLVQDNPESPSNEMFHVEDRDKSLILGLANRRRVWNACLTLADVYVKQPGGDVLKTIDTGDGDSDEIRDNSVSTQMPLVASPVSNDFQSNATYFIRSWQDVDRGAKVGFHFNSSDFLCSITVIFSGEESKIFGETSIGNDYWIEIPKGIWISGLVLNISGADTLNLDTKIGITGVTVLLQDGQEMQVKDFTASKRLLRPRPGFAIVGAIGESAKPPIKNKSEEVVLRPENSTLQRFGLLECPVPSSSIHILEQASQIEKCLWDFSGLPPQHLSASIYETGYWAPSRSFDTIPMSFILFGTTEAELSQLTGISSDPFCKGFSVYYQDGTSKTIGPYGDVPDTKTFKIDGPGGERVVMVEVGMNALPMAIKITTNRNRQAFFGQTQKNYHFVYAPSPKNTNFLAGIYVSWGYTSVQPFLCTTISVLSAPVEEGMVAEEVVGVRDNTVASGTGPPNERTSPLVRRTEKLAIVDEEGWRESGQLCW